MTRPITTADRQRAARRLGVTEDHVQALLQIEARGRGFLRARDLPVILFEGHVFYRETNGAHPQSDINYRRWTKQHYKGGIGEYDRLHRAYQLDRKAALRSASYGLWQIMGFNHEAAGYSTVEGFVNAMGIDEATQLDAGVSFILSNPRMAEAFRSESEQFFRLYNGRSYKKNAYDTRFFRALREAQAEDPERDQMRDVQRLLNLRGHGLSVDGWMGPKTAAAIRSFQGAVGIRVTGTVTPALLSALGIEQMEDA